MKALQNAEIHNDLNFLEPVYAFLSPGMAGQVFDARKMARDLAARGFDAVQIWDDSAYGGPNQDVKQPSFWIPYPYSDRIRVIKQADPITYDNSGNVIPLSQRFNPSSNDIRFQPDPSMPSVLNGSNGTRIIKSNSGKFRVYSGTGALLGIRDTQQVAEKLAAKP